MKTIYRRVLAFSPPPPLAKTARIAMSNYQQQDRRTADTVIDRAESIRSRDRDEREKKGESIVQRLMDLPVSSDLCTRAASRIRIIYTQHRQTEE